MVLDTTTKEQCAYSFYRNNPLNGVRESVDIKKSANKITVTLKGEPHQKAIQKKIIELRFKPDAIRKLNENVYSITIDDSPFPLLEGSLRFLRQQGIIAHHAYSPLIGRHTSYYLTDKIILRFQEDATDAEIEQLLRQYQLQKKEELAFAAKTWVVEVTDQSGSATNAGKGKNPVKVAEMLEQEKLVENADVNLISRLVSLKDDDPELVQTRSVKKAKTISPEFTNPQDPLFDKQWSLQSKATTRARKPWINEDADINATEAWQLAGYGSKEITIAVIDMSIDFDHPDLKNQLCDSIENIKRDFIFHDGGTEVQDHNLRYATTHGTQCAGIALAENNSRGVVGIASGCKLLPVWLNANASEATIIKCFQAVSAKADVISFSLAPYPGKMIFNRLKDALTEITATGGPRGRGCVICVCAGNFNVPIHQKLTAITTYYTHEGVKQDLKKGEEIYNLYAAHEGVITVTACTSLNTAAAYNNYGPEVSVCAPSADWKPEIGMEPLTSAGIYTTTSKETSTADWYATDFCGTSAATPLVAGVAALMLSANNNLTAAEVKEVLQQTADKIDPENAKYDKQGHSDRYGYGKINAARAVQAALNMKEHISNFRTLVPSPPLVERGVEG